MALIGIGFMMCADFSEMERELIRERVRSGVEAAPHTKGRKGGRPRALQRLNR